MPAPAALAVIACAVLETEIRHFAADLAGVRRLTFLPQGLHNEPVRLQRDLQAAVAEAEADPSVEAIALVYGLCSRGVENLRHSRCPLVIARAHDCITLLLVSKERYTAYADAHPGTYWYSPGWIAAHAPPGPDRDAHLRRDYAARFAPDEVDYLMEADRAWIANYRRATYVSLQAGETDRDIAYTRECAACLGWEFDRLRGDPALLRALLTGPWDDARFLVVPPGHGIRMTADASVIRSVPLDGPAP